MSNGRRWMLRILIGVVAAVVVVIIGAAAMAAYWRRIPVGAGTTRISGPLAGDGMPDYLAAVNENHEKGVTAANNAAPGVLAVVGLGGEPMWRNAELKLLGLADPGEGKLEDYGKWLTAQRKGEAGAKEVDTDEAEGDLMEAGKKVWRKEEQPELAGYVESQGAGLDELEGALGRERFFMPAVTEDGASTTAKRPALLTTMLPETGRFRKAGRLLMARAMMRLGRGDGAGFERDVEAQLKFSRLILQQPSLIDYLVALAIRGDALRAAEAGAASGKLDGKTAGELREKLAAEAAWPAPAKVIDECERFMCLDVECGMAAGGTVPTMGGGAISVKWVPVNFSRGMREANGLYDRARDAYGEKRYEDRRRLLEGVESDVRTMASGGMVYQALHLEEMALEILLPSMTRGNVLYTTGLADERLAEDALALRVYRAEHGGYPAGLEEAGVSGGAGVDPFVDKPLVYRREGTGYVLYCVGEDLTDDGGKPRGKSTKAAGWDLVVKATE